MEKLKHLTDEGKVKLVPNSKLQKTELKFTSLDIMTKFQELKEVIDKQEAALEKSLEMS